MSNFYWLTKRQTEVAKLLLFSNKEIAKTLVVELSTIKSLVHSVLKKTNSGSRAEAVLKLVKSGDIDIKDVVLPNGEIPLV